MSEEIHAVATPSQEMSSSNDVPQRIAIFDLDGTLTTQDTFLAFLITYGRRNRRYAALARTPFRIATYLAKLIKDYRLKETLIRDFLSAEDQRAIDNHCQWFCDQWLPKRMHPIGTELLRSHQQRNDRIILLSASPDIVVPMIAERLGISELVCTRLERSCGSMTGRIDGVNCKGEHKVTAIQRYLNCETSPPNSYAYGDSKSDRYILNWVRHGSWVHRRGTRPFDPDLTTTESSPRS